MAQAQAYEFPRAIEALLGFPAGCYVEALRGDKGWVAAITTIDTHRRRWIGSGLSLETALDDLAAELAPAPPRLHERGISIALGKLRQLEKLFTSETTCLQLSCPTIGQFQAALTKIGDGILRRASGTSPALALAQLAAAEG